MVGFADFLFEHHAAVAAYLGVFAALGSVWLSLRVARRQERWRAEDEKAKERERLTALATEELTRMEEALHQLRRGMVELQEGWARSDEERLEDFECTIPVLTDETGTKLLREAKTRLGFVWLDVMTRDLSSLEDKAVWMNAENAIEDLEKYILLSRRVLARIGD